MMKGITGKKHEYKVIGGGGNQKKLQCIDW